MKKIKARNPKSTRRSKTKRQTTKLREWNICFKQLPATVSIWEGPEWQCPACVHVKEVNKLHE